jgi:hypothetical protein
MEVLDYSQRERCKDFDRTFKGGPAALMACKPRRPLWASSRAPLGSLPYGASLIEEMRTTEQPYRRGTSQNTATVQKVGLADTRRHQNRKSSDELSIVLKQVPCARRACGEHVCGCQPSSRYLVSTLSSPRYPNLQLLNEHEIACCIFLPGNNSKPARIRHMRLAPRDLEPVAAS